MAKGWVMFSMVVFNVLPFELWFIRNYFCGSHLAASIAVLDIRVRI
jgi:hypothetical protein